MHFNTEIGVNNVPHDYQWYSSSISETHFLEINIESLLPFIIVFKYFYIQFCHVYLCIFVAWKHHTLDYVHNSSVKNGILPGTCIIVSRFQLKQRETKIRKRMSLELLEVQLLQMLKVHMMSRKEKKVMPIFTILHIQMRVLYIK